MPVQLTVADFSPGASDNFVGVGNGVLQSPSPLVPGVVGGDVVVGDVVLVG